MRKLFGFLLFLVVAAGLLIALLPYFLSTDILRTKVAEQLSAWTGREVRLAGAASLTVFPNVSVDISDISIANGPGFGDEPMIAMDALRVRVQLMPLLTGDIRVDRFELIRPRIDLVVDADGNGNWELPQGPEITSGGDEPAAGNGESAPSVKLGLLLIEDGILRYRNLQTGAAEEITALGASLNWPDQNSVLESSGSLVWKGEVIRYQANLDDPASFFNMGSSQATLAIVSSPARVTVTGLASMTADLAVNGGLNLEIPSLRGLARWLGSDMPSGSGLGQLTIQSNIIAGGHKIALTEAQIELDGNSAEGAVTIVSNTDKLYLQATLALSDLDLNPYFMTSAPVESGASGTAPVASHGWSNEPFGLDGLGVMDADIRLSASNIDLGEYDLGAGAVSIALQDSRLVLEIAEVNAYSGQLSGNIVINARGDRPSMTAKINSSEIAIGPLLNDIADNGRLVGVTNMVLDLASSGISLRDVVGNLSGAGQIQVTDGEIVGINIASALNGLQRGDISTLMIGNNGRTQFDFLEASFTIAAGVATNNDLMTRGPAFSALGSGTVNIPQETLDYKVRASLLDQTRPEEGEPGAPLFEVPMSIRGSWAAPRIRPDLTGLIQGNERVQEVVQGVGDALREGNLDGARDAIEGAIEGGEGEVRSLLDNFLNRSQAEQPPQN